MRQISFLKITPFLAAVLLASCGESDRNASSANDAVQVKKVRVETVQVVTVKKDVTFTATVEADKVTIYAPAMGGRIRRFSSK